MRLMGEGEDVREAFWWTVISLGYAGLYSWG